MQLPQRKGCSRAVLLQTVLSYVANFQNLEPYDKFPYEVFIKGRSPDAIHHALPKSLGIPDHNNTKIVAALPNFLPDLHNFTFTLMANDTMRPIVDEENCTVVIHTTASGNTSVGLYRNEALFTLKMTEDGSQIREVWEFVDSALLMDYLKRLNLTSKF